MRNTLTAIVALLSFLTVAPARAQDAATAPVRVMFVGNSLVYANDLPRLLRALAAAQPGRRGIATSTWAAPGGTLAERWDDGHAAAALAASHWDVLVLQERGGLLACMASVERRREAQCRASERAHRQFTELAAANGTRVLLLSTWGKDAMRAGQRGNPRRKSRLDEATDALAMRLRNGGADIEVVPAGALLREWSQVRQDAAAAFPDGTHPGLPASLVMAAQLYRAVAGEDAQAHDLRIDFPLLPANALVKADAPMETQPQIAGDGSVVVLKDAALAPYLEVARGSK